VSFSVVSIKLIFLVVVFAKFQNPLVVGTYREAAGDTVPQSRNKLSVCSYFRHGCH